MRKLKVISFHMPEELIEEVDELVKEGLYKNRSHVVRVAVVRLLRKTIWKQPPDSPDSSLTDKSFSPPILPRGMGEPSSPNRGVMVPGTGGENGERREDRV